jgi:hypothetical protein
VAIKATPAGVYICPSLVAICSEGEKGGEDFVMGLIIQGHVRIGKDRGTSVTHSILNIQIYTRTVRDPWHFGTVPDPRIRTTYLRIRIRILLFSPVADKMPTKKQVFKKFFCLILSERHLHTSVFKEKKSNFNFNS